MDGATALSIVNSLLSIFLKIGMGPIVGLVITIVIGPWMFSLVMTYLQGKRYDTMSTAQNERFEAVKLMYENNVRLVECYQELSGEQRETIALNTAEWADVKAKIESNQFCPLLRVKKERMEDVPR
jgi:hypothetical protein